MRSVAPNLLALLAFCAFAAAPAAASDAYASLVDAEGDAIGRAHFEQTPGGVLLLVEVVGLPPGAHGIHLHGVGSCEPNFGAAKGHINPNGTEHGLRNPNGPDPGDLPNLHVGADGSATAEFYTERVRVREAGGADEGEEASGDAKPALLDADGSALIIHDHPDDHRSQPIGGAGGRIGCGVIKAMNDAAS